MRKTITVEWLKEIEACPEAVREFSEQKENRPVPLLKKMIRLDRLDWANWLVVRLMTYKQYVSYAVYAAERVVSIYEKKYPNDDRPRKAIKAAKECIKFPTKKNKDAAAYAAADAYAADAYAAAAAAVRAAADAAYAAAADAAYAAADAAADAAAAAYAAVRAADAARKKMKIRILKYGIKLF